MREYIYLILICSVLFSGCITGDIQVTSSPDGSEVYFDTMYQGTTPSTIKNVAFGNHTIEFRHQGYKNWSTNVSISSDTSLIFSELRPIPTLTPTSLITPTPTATQPLTPLPNSDKYALCDKKYPGTTYNPSTDKCERDNYKYCNAYFPGSNYDSITKTCVFPTPTQPPVSYYSYCTRNYPGTIYNPSTNKCEYPSNFNWYEWCAHKYPGTHYNPSTYTCDWQK